MTDVGTDAAVLRAATDALDVATLYDLLRLRSDVFVVEQDCVFLDLDGRDLEPSCEHLWTVDDAGITAAVRILEEGDGTWSIGRVVTRRDARGRGLSAGLVEVAVARIAERGGVSIVLGAQAHLERFYGRCGFVRAGDRYLEDGILHVPMRRTLGADR